MCMTHCVCMCCQLFMMHLAEVVDADGTWLCTCVCFVLVFLVLLAEFVLVGARACLESLHTEYVCVCV